jgi:hypothetical protein
MSELVSPPIIAFGRLMLPERFAGHGRTPRNHRPSHRFEALPVHVIALRTSPEEVLQSVASDRRLELARRDEKLT